MKHSRILLIIVLVLLTISVLFLTFPLQAKALAGYHAIAENTTAPVAAFAESSENMILVELCSQGLLDPEFLTVNEKFGVLVDTEYPFVLDGFQAWAPVVVSWMRRSKPITSLVNGIIKPWTAEVAYIMGETAEGSFLGKIEMYFGFIVSWAFGVMTAYFYIQIAWLLLVSFWMYLILRRIFKTLLVPVWKMKRKESLNKEKTPEVS